METDKETSDSPALSPVGRLLERAAAGLLLLVLAALGWMIVASYIPEWGRLGSLDLEVVLVVGLLLATLILVSVVALLHTRR
ncbi:MAG: hypothetical protein ACM3U2_14095 [Deltaproteobacteria bacterium]